MSLLIEELKKYGDLIVPGVDLPEKNTANPFNPGLRPDRLILKVTKNKSNIDDGAVSDLINNIKEKFIREYFGEKDRKTQNFHHHFQIHCLKITLNEKDDPIRTIYPLLDSMEQKASLVSHLEKSTKSCLWVDSLFKTLYDSAVIPKPFPNIQEIALGDIISNINYGQATMKLFEDNYVSQSTELEIRKKIKEFANDDYRFYHNYTAIVNADVDDLQPLLQALYHCKEEDALCSFSKTLMQYGQFASDTVAGLHGVPVYMGGDDLLFFSLVKYSDRTIFDIIETLDQKFREMMLENCYIAESIALWNSRITIQNRRKHLNIPTISWGIALSYLNIRFMNHWIRLVPCYLIVRKNLKGKTVWHSGC